MGNKKGIIIVIIVLDIIILLLLGFSFLTYKHKTLENVIKDGPNDIIEVPDVVDDKANMEDDNATFHNETVSDNTSNNIVNNGSHRDQDTDSHQDNTSSSQTVTPVIPTVTYVCPEGYNLNGTKCISVVAANYVCPENTHDYSNENIPRDKYCVNLTEGYQTDTDFCPDNYGIIAVLGFGTPTVYRCFPLHEKVYMCDDEYILDGSECTKTIDAIQN